MVRGTDGNRWSGQHKCGRDGERGTTKKLCGAEWVCGGMVVIRDLTDNVRSFLHGVRLSCGVPLVCTGRRRERRV
jgi:hypothetical protein